MGEGTKWSFCGLFPCDSFDLIIMTKFCCSFCRGHFLSGMAITDSALGVGNVELTRELKPDATAPWIHHATFWQLKVLMIIYFTMLRGGI